ncbi:MAG: AMP-binding protein, partial [Anaerovoracaceae bacterium]
QIVMLAAGVVTTYCDGLKYLQKNIVEYKVSVFFCVPLLIESIYKKIMLTVKKEGLEKKVNFGLKVSGLLLKLGIDVRRKLFEQILDQLGGNIRFVISGASAIDPEAIEGFNRFGITAVQGFGMTEASPILAAENHWERRPGSIGKAIPGVELAIDQPDADGVGELIARGPNIMAGYYENPEETEKTLAGGWLHTGDLAYVDKDGYVFICGRKKNVIVLKNGKNVYPEEIELLISNLPYVEENMVFGQPRHDDGDEKDLAICAKIVYKPDYMKDTLGLSTAEEIEAFIRRDIDAINEQLPTYKQIFRLVITDQPMIKTTTGKVKRYEEAKKL